MKEFWMWVVIVTLMILCIMGLSFLVLHNQKQIRKTEVILMRLEEKERKNKANEALTSNKESPYERPDRPVAE